MDLSMHAPKTSARQNPKSWCGPACTIHIDELNKMVHALEFRVRNLESITAIPQPTQQLPCRARSQPPRSTHKNSNSANSSAKQKLEGFIANNHPKTFTSLSAQYPQAHIQIQPQHQPPRPSQLPPQPQAQPRPTTRDQATIVGAGLSASPREREVNMPTNEHIKFIQTMHAKGMGRNDIVQHLLNTWPYLHRGLGFPTTPEAMAARERAQRELCGSMVDMNTSPWASRLT